MPKRAELSGVNINTGALANVNTERVYLIGHFCRFLILSFMSDAPQTFLIDGKKKRLFSL